MSIGLKGNVDGSGAVQVGGSDAITISTGLVVTMNGGAVYPITQSTSQVTTSGTNFDFTGIPATAKRITILFDGVSLSGTEDLLVQIGPTAAVETTGYLSSSGSVAAGSTNVSNSTAGFVIRGNGAANITSGSMVLNKFDSTNTWIASHSAKASSTVTVSGGGDKTLADVLARVAITRSGTNTFDAGAVNITWE